MAISIKVTGAKEEFDSIDSELVSTVNQLSRIQGLDTVNELKATTPVDTGRARNSWVLTSDPNNFVDAEGGYPGIGGYPLPPVSTTKIETLFITNGTPYIEDLNRGSSKQAPARFVENTVLKAYTPDGVLFETINKE